MEDNIQSSEVPAAKADKASPGSCDITELTRRMTGGDEMAWKIFYNTYFDRLWRYLLVVAHGNEDVARESLQAALVRVARHIKVFRDENTFWSWLTVVVRTSLADETKKQRRYLSFLDRFAGQADIELAGTTDLHTDDELKRLLERHMKLLSPDEQSLVEQKYFRRRAVREIADELQATEKAVESKLSRIRKKLKDAMLAELNEPKD